ncbi:MAG: exonuclease subunit SbcD, partial [Clostridia bacterium]|nr:exonuclease subunit SbcD [Clostridia bacterium]
MKFLHTSDLHLGKKLDGVSRLDEQTAVLAEITEICDANDIDVVIISGDVFDTFMPSAEAENLFFDFAAKTAAKKRVVVVISGNHDDGDRLNASKLISEKYGVYLCGKNNSYAAARFGRVSLAACGEYFIDLKCDDGEGVHIVTLPYFSESPEGEVVDREEDYGERVGRILGKAADENAFGFPVVCVSHLFMLGGVVTEGERAIDLGGARVVSPEAIPQSAVYTALGHLHRRQTVKKERNIIYSGSPLQYSYDESGTEKSVTVFEIEGGKLSDLQVVGLKCGKRLACVTAYGVAGIDEAMKGEEDKFVCLTLYVDG